MGRNSMMMNQEQQGGCEKKGAWSEEEDKQLLDIIRDMEERGLPVKWCAVSKKFPSRSPKQCRERYVYNLDPNISKEPWSCEEDALLIYAQQQLGNAWARIAACLPGRTENSTKTRFKSILRAQKRIWKKDEDSKLLELHELIGSRWEEIAQSLPGRTKNAVRTRYRYLKGEISEDGPRPGSPSQAICFDEHELAIVSSAFASRLAILDSATTTTTNSSSMNNNDHNTISNFHSFVPIQNNSTIIGGTSSSMNSSMPSTMSANNKSIIESSFIPKNNNSISITKRPPMKLFLQTKTDDDEFITPKFLVKANRTFEESVPISPIARNRPKRARAVKNFNLGLSSDDDDDDDNASDEYIDATERKSSNKKAKQSFHHHNQPLRFVNVASDDKEFVQVAATVSSTATGNSSSSSAVPLSVTRFSTCSFPQQLKPVPIVPIFEPIAMEQIDFGAACAEVSQNWLQIQTPVDDNFFIDTAIIEEYASSIGV